MLEDMLVKLYDLPPYAVGQYQNEGVQIKRPIAAEQHVVTKWVGEQFSAAWESEAIVAFGQSPVTCFVAYHNAKVVGFACYNTTAKGFFGPTGVADDYRGKGVGKALLLESLYALRYDGHGYAIIGRVGPADFYKRSVNATVIEGSDPGIYKNLLR